MTLGGYLSWVGFVGVLRFRRAVRRSRVVVGSAALPAVAVPARVAPARASDLFRDRSAVSPGMPNDGLSALMTMLTA